MIPTQVFMFVWQDFLTTDPSPQESELKKKKDMKGQYGRI